MAFATDRYWIFGDVLGWWAPQLRKVAVMESVHGRAGPDIHFPYSILFVTFVVLALLVPSVEVTENAEDLILNPCRSEVTC